MQELTITVKVYLMGNGDLTEDGAQNLVNDVATGIARHYNNVGLSVNDDLDEDDLGLYVENVDIESSLTKTQKIIIGGITDGDFPS